MGIFARGQNDQSWDPANAGMSSNIQMTCGKVIKTSNNRPTAVTNPTCVIPKKTPFELSGYGSDPDANTVRRPAETCRAE